MQTRGLRHVRKRAVAVVAIQHAGQRRVVVSRAAIVRGAHQAETLQLGGGGPVDVAQHVEVEVAVPVVIHKSGAGAPALAGDARGGSRVGETAVPVVAEQDIRSGVGDEQVGVAVVVVVSRGYAHTVAGDIGSAAGGDVLE